MKHRFLTARNASLISCHSCHLLCKRRFDHNAIRMKCPRCNATLHQRKPNSIKRTWALTIAAAILYVPANLFPITEVVSYGKAQSDTILSGVVYFMKTGMWHIALIIFVASVVVPLLKLIILTFLLIT